MPSGGGHRGALAQVAPVHSCIPAQPERQPSRRYAVVARQLRARVQGRRGVPDLLLSDSRHGWAASPHDLLHLLKGLSPSLPVQVVSIISQVCVPALPVALVIFGCADANVAGHARGCQCAGTHEVSTHTCRHLDAQFHKESITVGENMMRISRASLSFS